MYSKARVKYFNNKIKKVCEFYINFLQSNNNDDLILDVCFDNIKDIRLLNWKTIFCA